MPKDKKKKLSQKELDTINFRDSVTKKLKGLEDRERQKEKQKIKEANKARRRSKRNFSIKGLKGFYGFNS